MSKLKELLEEAEKIGPLLDKLMPIVYKLYGTEPFEPNEDYHPLCQVCRLKTLQLLCENKEDIAEW